MEQPAPRRLSTALVVVSALLVLLDVFRYALLPRDYQAAFTDGFETVVFVLVATSCGLAAARSSPAARTLWTMITVFLALGAAGDLHDFATDLGLTTGVALDLLESLGWLSYLVPALLIFFPTSRKGRLHWTWLPVLDFVQVTLAVMLVHFESVYVPHLLLGRPWTMLIQAAVARGLVVSGGLLLRWAAEPSRQQRAIYGRFGSLLATLAILRAVFPDYFNPVYAVTRPALWLLFGVVATRWEGVAEDETRGKRRVAVRLVLSLCATATLVVVLVLALTHEASLPYRALRYVVVGVSIVAFVLRNAVAERMRHAAETRLRKSQGRLEESEARFRTVIERAPVAIGVSRDAVTTYVNRKYVEMYGFDTVDGLVGHGIGERWAPAARATIEERARLRSRGVAVPNRYEAVGLRKDGSQLLVQVDATIVDLPDGPATLAFLTDVTEVRRAEEQIRASEEKFRTAFMTGADAFYLATLEDGRIIEANDRFEDVFGYTREEAIGRTSLDLGLYAGPADRAKLVAEVKARGHVHNLELSSRRKNGESGVVLISTNLLADSDPPMMIGVVRDITDKKRFEHDLIRLRQAVQASGEAIFMTDRDGAITFVNPAFTALYGYEADEVVHKVTPRILKSGRVSDADYAALWATILQKQVARGTIVNRARDGTLLTVESSANPVLNEHGDIVGFLAIQRDVTARKRLEEQFLQAQKMEAVGRLAGGVAHDFNNLLTVINGYSQLLLDTVASDSPMRADLADVLAAGERASALTRQLLAFSRKAIPEPTILDLNVAVKDLEKMLRRLIGEDIELTTSTDGDPVLVKADPTQIEQVVLNLVVNARDAMPRGGGISIGVSAMELDGAHAGPDLAAGRYAVLRVRDTGSGIDAATMAHIFEPFFTTKASGKGSGLGLSTVYGIVHDSGGHITVESATDCGTTFTIFLPEVSRSAGATREFSDRIGSKGGSETILLVEDEEGVRTFVARVLRESGYRVLEAASGPHGFEIAERHGGPIDLLLTDVVMPGMTGPDVAARLALSHPKLRVLYMTGYTDRAVYDQGIKGPGEALLQKPFGPEILTRKVREVLDGPPTAA